MAKLTLTDITSGYSTASKINTNNGLIETAMENTLSRDGTSPNTMAANLDMSSYRIQNLPNAVSNQEPVTLAQAATIAGVTNPLTQESVGAVLYPRTSAETTAGVTPTNYYYEPGDVRRYGAVGNGSTDDSSAIQDALDTGIKLILIPDGTYLCNTQLRITTSGQQVRGSGTISSPVNVGGIIIGYNGSAFTKTDNVVIEGITISGNATAAADGGAGGLATSGIAVQPPTDDPYVDGNGCSNIRIVNVNMTGHTIGFIATGANKLQISGCHSTGMVYASALSAGGYGVLFQTCFDVIVDSSTFIGVSGDRHAIYISANSARTLDANNVCKRVVISNNNINWTNITATTGYETCVAIRGAFDISVTGNTIVGGHGCIDYQLENASGENISITGNTLAPNVSDSTTRAAISFMRASGSYLASGVTITGNTVTVIGETCHGIQVAFANYANVSNNTIISTDAGNTNSIGILFDTTTNVTVGGNTIQISVGAAGVAFSSTNDEVLINKNHINGSGYIRYRFTTPYTVPTNLRWGFSRTFSVTSDGVGGVTVADGDEEVVASAASDAQGVIITVSDGVRYTSKDIVFTSAGSNIGQVYWRTSGSGTVTCGVLNSSGVAMPAASNAYTIVGTVLQ